MLTCFFFHHWIAKAEECLQSDGGATDAISIVSSAPDAVWEAGICYSFAYYSQGLSTGEQRPSWGRRGSLWVRLADGLCLVNKDNLR